MLFLWYRSTTQGDRSQIWYHITHAPAEWIAVSILLGVISHVSRAIRWNYLLEPLGYRPKISGNFLMVMIAYFANLGIPRSGEVLRATALSNYEGVPFEKGFGTIVTERIIDLFLLLLVVVTAVVLQTGLLYDYFREQSWGLLLLLLVGLAGIGGLILSIRFLRGSEHPLAKKFLSFLDGLVQGIGSIMRMEKRWEFLGHTMLIWTCYIGMFWVLQYALPETSGISFPAILTGFIAGAFAMTTTNGGIGLYPVAVGYALALFGVDANSGSALGWIIWISQTLMVVALGTISFALLPFLYSRQLK